MKLHTIEEWSGCCCPACLCSKKTKAVGSPPQAVSSSLSLQRCLTSTGGGQKKPLGEEDDKVLLFPPSFTTTTPTITNGWRISSPSSLPQSLSLPAAAAVSLGFLLCPEGFYPPAPLGSFHWGPELDFFIIVLETGSLGQDPSWIHLP